MLVKRYLDIIKQEDILAVKHIIENKDRIWKFQTSDPFSTNIFFISYLLENEQEFFLEKLNAIKDDYILRNNIKEKVSFERSYINCHPCHHPGDFHIDNLSGFTMLYYPSSEENFENDGGTEIVGHGVEPYISNSVLIFPANFLHAAQGHTIKGKFRYSVAFKFYLEFN